MNPTTAPDMQVPEKNKILPRTLYLVATPIGNLADLSERAIKVLSEVDFIAAEDTRNTAKLLSILGFSKPLISYFEHNKNERGEQILARIESGESCALVTDAGTPAISDPGEDLVRLCAERRITVTSIPGCCAAITALTLSGLATGKFVFEGFLGTNNSERKKRLDLLAREERTTILYEAPHRLCTTLEELLKALGNRRITLCRELTKLNEEVMRTDLEGAVAYYMEHAPRGEYVLVLDGTKDADSGTYWDQLSVMEHIEHHMEAGLERMDAIKATAKERGVSKSVIYAEFVKNSKKDE